MLILQASTDAGFQTLVYKIKTGANNQKRMSRILQYYRKKLREAKSQKDLNLGRESLHTHQEWVRIPYVTSKMKCQQLKLMNYRLNVKTSG